jgi:glycosyltransferase involved in cell wall biosynthesis
MTVSVVIPVYNTVCYVAEAIESILAQTFPDFELIVIDDGSTDGCGEILSRYAIRDPRVRIIHRENRGIVASRNEGIALASGEFLAVLDSDDVALPGRLALQLAYLKDHPDCVAVGGSALVIDSAGDTICTWRFPCTHDELDALNLVNDQRMLHSSLTMRREVVRNLLGYREEAETAEELDLLLRMGEVGQLANVPEVVVKYRRHGDSVSHARRARQVLASHFAIQDARRRRAMVDLETRVSSASRPPSRAENHRQWAWWALGESNFAAARNHARKAVRSGPLDLESWRVFFHAMRGRRRAD